MQKFVAYVLISDNVRNIIIVFHYSSEPCYFHDDPLWGKM